VQGKELVRAVLAGERVGRPPVGPLAVHYCAKLAGYSASRYSTNPRALAESVMCYFERFRPDAIWLSADTWVTAEAMGAEVSAAGDDVPLAGVGGPVIKELGDLDRLPPPDPLRLGRWPVMLEAMSLIRERVGEDAFLVGCFDQYPFSVACQLLGTERAMMAAPGQELPLLEAVMERAVEYSLAYAAALAERGADMLSGGDSPAGLLGPELYRRVALPYEQRLIAALKAKVSVPVSLHICGDTSRLLPDMAASGADVLELDHQVDMAAAARAAGDQLTLWGNLDTVSLLMDGDADQVRAAALELIEQMRRVGHSRFVLSSGCTLAANTPEANVAAMIDAAKRYACSPANS